MTTLLILISACTINKKPVPATEKEPEILYIYPDGSMEFKDRIMNPDEVIIYEDGFGGERAAVLLRVPYKEDIYRDTITVERKEVPVERIGDE